MFPGAKVARRPNAIPISARTSREPTTAPVSPPLAPLPRRPMERVELTPSRGSMDERERIGPWVAERGWAVKANRAPP